MCVLIQGLGWHCRLLNELIHSRPRPLFDYFTVVDCRSCIPYTVFRLTAPVVLSTRYTTPDIVLQNDSKTAIVE